MCVCLCVLLVVDMLRASGYVSLMCVCACVRVVFVDMARVSVKGYLI
jgi:hypothetical protein